MTTPIDPTAAQFTLTFSTENAAFSENGVLEVATILRNAAYRLEQGEAELGQVNRVRDTNGNRVGFFTFNLPQPEIVEEDDEFTRGHTCTGTSTCDNTPCPLDDAIAAGVPEDFAGAGEDNDTELYEVVRFERDSENEVITTDLTLEEAKAAVNSPGTSGEGWFLGYRAL